MLELFDLLSFGGIVAALFMVAIREMHRCYQSISQETPQYRERIQKRRALEKCAKFPERRPHFMD